MTETEDKDISGTGETNEAEQNVTPTADKTEKKARNVKNEKKIDREIRDLISKAENERDTAIERYQRILAEYDNFRKRTAKEKETVYTDAYNDVLSEILPAIDNLERAVSYSDDDKFSQGIKMIVSQFASILMRLGIEEINPKAGELFNPKLHNAVMHSESGDFGENSITAVVQKGYKRGDKIFRHAMVSVAN